MKTVSDLQQHTTTLISLACWLDDRTGEQLSLVTCCGRWRQRTPSCVLNLELSPCWVSAAQRSCEGWTERFSASHGRPSPWMSSVGPCSCADGTNQSGSPPGGKHTTHQLDVSNPLFSSSNDYQCEVLPAYFLPGFSSQHPHSRLPRCRRSCRHKDEDETNIWWQLLGLHLILLS